MAKGTRSKALDHPYAKGLLKPSDCGTEIGGGDPMLRKSVRKMRKERAARQRKVRRTLVQTSQVERVYALGGREGVDFIWKEHWVVYDQNKPAEYYLGDAMGVVSRDINAAWAWDTSVPVSATAIIEGMASNWIPCVGLDVCSNVGHDDPLVIELETAEGHCCQGDLDVSWDGWKREVVGRMSVQFNTWDRPECYYVTRIRWSGIGGKGCSWKASDQLDNLWYWGKLMEKRVGWMKGGAKEWVQWDRVHVELHEHLCNHESVSRMRIWLRPVLIPGK